jgi:hypothetical protein
MGAGLANLHVRYVVTVSKMLAADGTVNQAYIQGGQPSKHASVLGQDSTWIPVQTGASEER